MVINGNQQITTYFVLNKRDRGGKVVLRPFQAVLEEVKRQETERAKMIQSSNLKSTANVTATSAAPTPIPSPTIAINEKALAPPPATPAPVPAQTLAPPVPAPDMVQMPIPEKHIKIEEKQTSLDENIYNNNQSSVDPSIKTLATNGDSVDSSVVPERKVRSRTCAVL